MFFTVNLFCLGGKGRTDRIKAVSLWAKAMRWVLFIGEIKKDGQSISREVARTEGRDKNDESGKTVH